VLQSVGHFIQLLIGVDGSADGRVSYSHKSPYLKEKYYNHDVCGGHNVVSNIKFFFITDVPTAVLDKPLKLFPAACNNRS
jgi:hypothetical protein